MKVTTTYSATSDDGIRLQTFNTEAECRAWIDKLKAQVVLEPDDEQDGRKRRREPTLTSGQAHENGGRSWGFKTTTKGRRLPGAHHRKPF